MRLEGAGAFDHAFAADTVIAAGRAVKVVGNYKVATAGAGEAAIGIALEPYDPAQDGPNGVAVRMQGIAKATAGAAITAGQGVEADANGKLVPLTTGAKIGTALTSAAGDGYPVDVLVGE